jgi:putative membrane protein
MMEQQEPKLSDVLAQKRTDLAAQRTIMAADRSLIAWLRTGLSLIGFGFTIFKALQYLAEQGTTLTFRKTGPRDIGLFLIALGTGSLIFAIVDYWKSMKNLEKEYDCSPWRTALFATSGVALLGLFLILLIVLKIRVL